MSERRSDFKIPELLEKQLAKGTPFEFNFVDLEIKDDIAWITINRPEAMNALNSVVVEQLEKNLTKRKQSCVKGMYFKEQVRPLLPERILNSLLIT